MSDPVGRLVNWGSSSVVMEPILKKINKMYLFSYGESKHLSHFAFFLIPFFCRLLLFIDLLYLLDLPLGHPLGIVSVLVFV